jgi:hypothetical protein
MEKLRFIKDHPTASFKKNQVVQMPEANVQAWIDSGYCVKDKEESVDLGNVKGSMKDLSVSKESQNNGGKSQKRFGSKKKNKKKKNK